MGRTDSRHNPWVVWPAVAVGVFVAVLVVGGYVAGWAWTGLSSHVTLWDWLEALLLPVTVGLVPLLVRHREHLGRPHRLAVGIGLVAFAVLVVAGYLVPLPWTGFTGNTLWDWLTLALLPVVIATATLWRDPGGWSRRHRGLVGGLGVAAVLVVLLGYVVPWAWTGFEGNTAWDWVKLLLLPVLIPVFVLPRLILATERWMQGRAAEKEEELGSPPAPTTSAPASSPGPEPT